MEYPDHRRIGRQLRMFATEESCGAGLPLWLPAGAAVRAEIERFVVDLERAAGYQHVYTPVLGKRELYERSGHWAHYRDSMYPPLRVGAEEVVLRPMNCPHHILVFASESRSARDLPWRVAELGAMFRLERSGVVGGLSRVRQMTLNDGHVFCLVDQLQSEIGSILEMVGEAYRALAIPQPRYRLSLRGAGPKYVAGEELWERSEAVLRATLDDLGLPFEAAADEAAFYGPKIDLQVQDPQGREETLSTVQVDLHLPERFGLEVQAGPAKVRPVMVHRSIVSTMERMVAHLLEVHDGALPVWLAPNQVSVLPVVPAVAGAAAAVGDRLRRHGLRVRLDGRAASLGARVREARLRRDPYVAVIGEREARDGTVAVRLRDGSRIGPMDVDAFVGLVDRVARERLPGLVPGDRSP